MQFSDYSDSFKTAKLSRTDSGVLTIQLHSRGEELTWTGLPHREWPDMFAAVAGDRKNRVVVITGTGAEFIRPGEGFSETLGRGESTAARWSYGFWEANRLIKGLLDIDVPTIAAVNGPVAVHSEIAVLCDIVFCTQDSYFQDGGHFPAGLVPGDGMQVIWPLLLGPNRGRHFLLTGAKIHADEALRLGVVAEIHPRDALLPRAQEVAEQLAARHPELLRGTRRVMIRSLRRAMDLELDAGLSFEAVASLSAAERSLDHWTDMR